jgi:hypothetical protein
VVGAENERFVQALAQSYCQESYLVIAEHDRIAYVVDVVTGHHHHLGKFRAVGSEEPACDAWTLLDGVYFVTDGRPGVDLPGGL